MNQGILADKDVAILATDGVEESELLEPKKALDEAGATTHIIAPKRDHFQGWSHEDKGQQIRVDALLDSAKPDSYDALLLPGGVLNADQLRENPDAVNFVRSFMESGKPVAAICHGPWLLVEADVLGGRTLTSWPSLQTDIRNAGGTWLNEQVVVDHGLITSRKPEDIPAFNLKMVKEFAEGRHLSPEEAVGEHSV